MTPTKLQLEATEERIKEFELLLEMVVDAIQSGLFTDQKKKERADALYRIASKI